MGYKQHIIILYYRWDISNRYGASMDVSKDGVCHPILAIQMRKDAERHDYPVVILTELWKINHPFYIVNFP
jgi:hypothetical protein